ncbi:MAG: Nif3-like dinuclear metal center hexameric protein [Synergistaceae bacterium]
MDYLRGDDTMLLSEILHKIEKRIPLLWMEEWDNSGLAFGCLDKDIKLISIALDVNKYTIREAIKHGSDLLITHHPSIFKPIKSLTYNLNNETALIKAIKHDIALYSIHTNWDVSNEGVNVILGDILKLQNPKPLYVPAHLTQKNNVWGIGTIGDLGTELTQQELLSILKVNMDLSNIILYNNYNLKKIKRVAIAGGSCGDLWKSAFSMGADIFITSDISYHQREDALEQGMPIINCDHGEIEKISLPFLSRIIESEVLLPVNLII